MSNRLIFKPDMIDFLDKTSRISKVSMLLLNGTGDLINLEGNFILRDGLDITYLSKSKIAKTDRYEYYNKGVGRTRIKIGRFARKFLSDISVSSYDINDREIEIFVNLFKSYFNRNLDNLKIVDGVEILKWYLEDNYQLLNDCRYGSLWNSCMRYNNRNSFMSLYTKNSNIKMLILLDDVGKLSARALLWEGVSDVDGKTYKVMDRIYSFHDHDVNFFKDWAKENGYIYKYEQSAKSERLFISNDIVVELDLTVQLENWTSEYYPYLDTFKFFESQYGKLSNSDKFKFQYILVQSNGGLFPEQPEPDDEGDYEDYDQDQDYDHTIADNF